MRCVKPGVPVIALKSNSKIPNYLVTPENVSMKIMIIGSMSFAREMLDAQAALTALGHTVDVPCDADVQASTEQFFDNLDVDRKFCIETDIMRKCFKLVEDADAVLALNHDKNGVTGYLGTSALMELGLAHYLKKKIYLLKDVPSPDEHRWAHEVLIFQPTVINGDLTQVI